LAGIPLWAGSCHAGNDDAPLAGSDSARCRDFGVIGAARRASAFRGSSKSARQEMSADRDAGLFWLWSVAGKDSDGFSSVAERQRQNDAIEKMVRMLIEAG